MTIIYIFAIMIILLLYIIRKNYIKRQFAGAFSGAMAGILVYYTLIPLLVLIFQDSYYNNIETYGFNNTIQQLIEIEPIKYYKAIGIIFITILSFCVAYGVRTPIRRRHTQSEISDQGALVNNNYSIVFLPFAKVLFFLCVPGVIIYVASLGGLRRALALAETIRGFSSSISTYTNPIFGYFNIIASFTSICSLLWFQIFTNKKNLINGLALIITIIATIIFCLVEAGRVKLLLYIFIMLFLIFKKRVKHIWLLVIILIPAFLPAIDLLSQLYIYFQTMDISTFELKETIYLNIIREFTYAIRSVLNLSEIMSTSSYLFFKHIILDTISLLPLVEMDKSYFLVSEFFNGPNWRLFGGVPSDFITYGYINLSIFGVMIYSWVWGKICYMVDKFIQKNKFDSSRDFWGITIACGMFILVGNSDWSSILYNNCYLTIPLLMLYFEKRRYRSTKIISYS